MPDPALAGAAHGLAALAGIDFGHAAEEIVYNVVAAGAVVALVWFRSEIFFRLGAAFRWLSARATGRRFVLVWIDDDLRYARKLIDQLRDRDGDRLNFRAIKWPRSLLFYPQSPKRTAGIVLLDTDVSKLADDPKAARLIEDRLCTFVRGGGGLIGSHDLIYRRTRNKELQSLFGCELTQFDDNDGEPVPYLLDPDQAAHTLATDLSEPFTLDDGEICWGDWDRGATVVFRSGDSHRRPLVTCNRYWDGRVVWLNSGDRSDQQCASIAKPEAPLVTLLHNALRWVREDA